MLWKLDIHFLTHNTNFGIIAVICYSMDRHSSINANSVGISKTALLSSTETELRLLIPSGLETALEFIPVTFVRIRACKIWWITHLTYFILLIIIMKTSASWNRSQVTTWHKATNSLNWTSKQEIVSYSIPEQQSTQVAFVIWCVPWELNKISQQEFEVFMVCTLCTIMMQYIFDCMVTLRNLCSICL